MSPIKTVYIADHLQLTRSREPNRFPVETGSKGNPRVLPNFLTMYVLCLDHATSKSQGGFNVSISPR